MVIALSGAKNFRDLGGIRTADGRLVKPGLFIRGGHLAGITDGDIELLAKIGPKTVIDMRTPEEESDNPDKAIPGSELIKLPLFSARTAGLSREKGSTLEALAGNCSSKDELFRLTPDLAAIYPLMARLDEPVAALSKVMHIIVENAVDGRATLYHCTAGKDRTGVVSLLILTALGVDYDTIMRDYLFTNKAVRAEADKYYLKLLISTRSRNVASKFRDCFVARRRYMDSFVEEINAKYGSVNGFIADGLGLGGDLIDQFKKASLL